MLWGAGRKGSAGKGVLARGEVMLNLCPSIRSSASRPYGWGKHDLKHAERRMPGAGDRRSLEGQARSPSSRPASVAKPPALLMRCEWWENAAFFGRFSTT